MGPSFPLRPLRGSAHDESPAHRSDAHDANFDEPVVVHMLTKVFGRLSVSKPYRVSICLGACFRQRPIRGSARDEVPAHRHLGYASPSHIVVLSPCSPARAAWMDANTMQQAGGSIGFRRPRVHSKEAGQNERTRTEVRHCTHRIGNIVPRSTYAVRFAPQQHRRFLVVDLLGGRVRWPVRRQIGQPTMLGRKTLDMLATPRGLRHT